MFGFFKKKRLISEDTIEWLYECYSWALDNFGSDIFYEDTKLVTPTHKYFPVKSNDDHIIAQKILGHVKEYSGMQNWPTKLIPQKQDANTLIAPTIVMQNAPRGPAGTFSMSRNSSKAIITYNVEHAKQPEKLVATLAHELAHYLSFSVSEPPPGGDNNWESATDLLAVFMGFGIFLCNSSFIFNQYTNYDTQGWSCETLGYLSRDEITYALAIFCSLKDIENKQVIPFLNSESRSHFKKAIKEILQDKHKIDDLRKIKKPIK